MELKNIEKLEKSIVELTIFVSEEELEKGKQAAYKKAVKNITVPGFRKGKAPRHLIEKLYGAGVFIEDAINIVYPEAYDKAVEEAKLDAVARGEVEMQDLPEGGGFIFTAKVPVQPEVKLGDYKGLKVEKVIAEVSDADIDAELDRMAKRIARNETVERAAKDGDTVIIDFEGFVDGVAFAGGKGENHPLTLGSGSFIPGFEEQLVGKSAGDECDVDVSFPEEYHAEDLKGKAAVFKCKVHSVQETVVPVLDDEFAKDVSDTCESLEDLKKEIREKQLKTREEQVDQDVEEKLLDGVLATFEADLPDALVEAQIDTIVQDFSYRLQMQGMSLERYAQMQGMDMNAFRDMFRQQAERQVKVRLSLQKIAVLENIEVDESCLDEEYQNMADNYGLEVEKVRMAVKPEALIGDLKITRALDAVKDCAKITMVAAKKPEVQEIDA